MEEGEWPRYFVGTPAQVREQLEQMAGELGIGELIVNTIVWEQAARLRSYELLAAAFDGDMSIANGEIHHNAEDAKGRDRFR